MQEKPELAASVRKKLGEIRQCWAELESTTQAKARQLFEASKADQLVQSFAELDKKLLHMESQLQDVDPGGDLATVNSQLKKLQVWLSWASGGPCTTGGRVRVSSHWRDLRMRQFNAGIYFKGLEGAGREKRVLKQSTTPGTWGTKGRAEIHGQEAVGK